MTFKFLVLLFLVPTALFAQPTQSFSHGDPTAEEQYMLELVNRGRANPAAEGARVIDTDDASVQQSYQIWQINKSATKQAFTTYPQRPPLAFNAKLIQAARGHTADMIQWNYQGHTSHNGDELGTRFSKAGYASQGQYGENVSAYSASIWFGHCGLMVDWGTQNQIDLGHRRNLLNFDGAVYTEIGIGITNSGGNPPSSVGPWVITQDFGITSPRYILGVVYADANSNGFYDIGEGLAGVKVSPPDGVYYATTSTSGGYALPYTGGSGTFAVTASGGPLASPMVKTITFGTDNIKVDFAPAPQAPGAVALVRPANNATAINRNQIVLKWNQVALSDDYEVHVASATNFSPASIVYNESTGSDSATINVPKCGTKYYWRVRARNIVGVGPWSPTFAFTTSGTTPSLPLTAAPKGATSIDLPGELRFRWGAFTGATAYHVRISPNNLFTTNIVDDSTITEAEFRMNPATGGITSGTWYWDVRTQNDCGWSNWSTPTQFALTITDVADEIAARGFAVAPNPVDASTSITFAPSAAISVQVATIDGRIIENMTIDGSTGTFAMSVLPNFVYAPSGVYMITLLHGNTRNSAVIIK